MRCSTLLILFFSIVPAFAQVNVPATKSPPKFVALNFAYKDQLSTIDLDTGFRNFADKKKFPLSMFINVSTLYRDKSGFPTPVEAKAFGIIENELLQNLKTYRVCYVGKTTVNGFRDLIFYIRTEDQRSIATVVGALKRKYSRVLSFTFENDPRWEAVAEFYDSLNTVPRSFKKN